MTFLTLRAAIWLLVVIVVGLGIACFLSILALSVWYQRYWPRGRE
jgi:hypothetical protein